MKRRRPLAIAALILSTMAGAFRAPLWAADDSASPGACLDEIRQGCAGFEDHLETCVDQRGAKLSPACREALKKAIAMTQAPGFGSCMAEVKKNCPMTDPDAFSNCLTEKQAGFSEDCQKELKPSTSASPASSPTSVSRSRGPVVAPSSPPAP
jgi:hypothetical protein